MSVSQTLLQQSVQYLPIQRILGHLHRVGNLLQAIPETQKKNGQGNKKGLDGNHYSAHHG